MKTKWTTWEAVFDTPFHGLRYTIVDITLVVSKNGTIWHNFGGASLRQHGIVTKIFE